MTPHKRATLPLALGSLLAMLLHPQGHPHEARKHRFYRALLKLTPEMMTEDAKFALGF